MTDDMTDDMTDAPKPVSRIQELRQLVLERNYRIELECNAENDKMQDWPLYMEQTL